MRGIINGAVVVGWVAFTACVAPGAMDGGMSTDGGKKTDGGTVVRDGGSGSAPEWQMADAHVAGRTGRDLRIGIKASDRNLDVVSVYVRLLDSNGLPVAGLDLNHDGVGDATEGTLGLEGAKYSGTFLTAAAWARGAFATGMPIAQVGVKLIDATALESEEQVVPVIDQTVVARGSACDPTFTDSRCEPGLGCRGSPAVCDEGLAPQIGRLAFYKGTNGPTILLEGTEPEDDLATVRFQFQDAQGHFIGIDSDGDGTPDLQSFDQDATQLSIDGAWFLRLQSGTGLDQQVPKLVATPIDAAGHTGMAKATSPVTQPIRAAGQACDPRGFDACGVGLTCSPGVVGATSNKCASSGPMRTAQCNAAPVLTPTVGGSVVMGVAEGGSLWDAPAGCSSADPTGRPEGIVVLRLTDRAESVRLSTVGAGTTFDTTIYVMPGCPADNSGSLGCNDDVMVGVAGSELVLHSLPSGDYLVVVDSFDPNGGTFELHATLGP
ncbi:MAG: hypothetical protein U0228_38005 [Myxococcaceae bacterium]